MVAHQAKSVCNCVEYLFPYDDMIHTYVKTTPENRYYVYAMERKHKMNKFQLILILINHPDEQHLLHKLLRWESSGKVFNFEFLLFSTYSVIFKLKMPRTFGEKQHEIQNVCKKNRRTPQLWPFV